MYQSNLLKPLNIGLSSFKIFFKWWRWDIALVKTSKTPLSFSTSGNYLRFIDKNNHHILDKSLGKSSNYYSSLSIMQNSWDIDLLDAYATALFNQSPSKLKNMNKKLQLSIIAIHQDREISLQNIEKLDIKSLSFSTSTLQP